MTEQKRTALICLSPGDPILSLDDAKAHLRVDFSDDDAYIGALCQTASATFDGADGWLKRALGEQQWRLMLPRFHHCSSRGRAHRIHPWHIDVPLPPLVSVDAIKYLDPAGVQQTLDPAAYKLVQCGNEESYIQPATGTSWPACQGEPDAVQIDFTAGYETLPAPILSAAKLLVGQWYEMRQAVIANNAIPYELPNGVKDLVANYRIVRF